jgi:hypothetical protein
MLPRGRGPHRVPPSSAGRSTVHIACARRTAAGRVRRGCCGSCRIELREPAAMRDWGSTRAAGSLNRPTLPLCGLPNPSEPSGARLVPRPVPPRPAGRRRRTAPARCAGARTLDASRQLPIPGRRSEPGVFPSHLRVPPVRPAKHHPHHYRRGKPSGQADQHPPPQAHPNPKRHIPNPGHGPCPLPITRRAMPARYGPARYGVPVVTARGRPARQRSAHS